MKVPLSGGTPASLATAAADALAVDNASVYWVSPSDCSSNMKQIRSAPKAGGSSVTVANLPYYLPSYGLALDNANVYVAQAGYSGSNVGAIMSTPKGGGSLTTLASGDANAANVIAIDSTAIYWYDGGLNKTPLGGGSKSQIASTPPTSGLVLANGALYWVYGAASGTVSTVSTAGGTVTDLATGLSYPSQAATDGSYVYFCTFNLSLSAWNMMKVPVTGGSMQMIASGPGSSPTSLAVDGTSVYWTTSSTVMKATPK